MPWLAGCDSNYSLTATEYADGRVSGSLTDRFSRGFGAHADMENSSSRWKATGPWVSGIVLSGFLAGQYVLASVQDNGIFGE